MFLTKTQRWKQPVSAEINSHENVYTQPNQALTAQQILSLYQQGRTVNGYREPAYSDQNIPDLHRMDKIQLEEFYKQQQQKVKDLQEKAENAKKQHDQELEHVKQLQAEAKQLERQKEIEKYLESKNK